MPQAQESNKNDPFLCRRDLQAINTTILLQAINISRQLTKFSLITSAIALPVIAFRLHSAGHCTNKTHTIVPVAKKPTSQRNQDSKKMG